MNLEIPKPRTFTEMFGDKYTTGRHVIFVKTGRWWRGYGLVKDVIHNWTIPCYQNPEVGVEAFSEQFGEPDSVHIFQSAEESKAEFPNFLLR